MFHEKLHKHIITNKINHVILVGTIIKCLNKKLPKDILLLHVEKVEDLVDEIEKLIKKIYLNNPISIAILVKGSNSVGLVKVVNKLKSLNSDTKPTN